MTDITFRIDGARETEKRLLALANDYGPRQAFNTLRAAMRRTLDPLLDELKAATSVDTSQLVQSARRVTVKPNKRNRGFGQHITPDTVISGQVGYFYRSDQRSHIGRSSIGQEFGNSRTVAKPVLRPLLARRGQQATRTLIIEIDRAIQARIKILNKQITKGTFTRR